MISELNEYDIQVLKMATGKEPWEQGAWVNAVSEYLMKLGLITRSGDITPKGKILLEVYE